ncbi:Thioredoxin domain-containing protein 5 [Dinochytrium kinnereticum]|nr:Thioredoxin domain-containing protein 5 [Dinochytrium kinnereticum]
MHLTHRPIAILLVLTAVLASIASGRPLSEEEKRERRLKADEANKRIRFIAQGDLKEKTKEGLWLVMFGAVWCPYTQKATPKWLEFQDAFDKSHPTPISYGIGKVECGDNEAFCQAEQKVDGYPTVLVYTNGTILEEYLGDDSADPMLEYFNGMIKRIGYGPSDAAVTPVPVSKEKSEEAVVAVKGGAEPTPGNRVEKSKLGQKVEEEERGGDDGAKEKAIIGGSFGGFVFLATAMVVGVIGYRVYSRRTPKEKYKSLHPF